MIRTTAQSGMTRFELLWSLLAVAGALVGGVIGYTHFGVGGALLGVPIGGAVGSCLALVLALLLAAFLSARAGDANLPPRPPGDGDHSSGKAL